MVYTIENVKPLFSDWLKLDSADRLFFAMFFCFQSRMQYSLRTCILHSYFVGIAKFAYNSIYIIRTQ